MFDTKEYEKIKQESRGRHDKKKIKIKIKEVGLFLKDS